MLVDIRRNIQKVAAIAIIGLLVLAFASWGIGDYVSGFSQIRVATVDGKNITDQAFARARQLQEQRYRNQLGDNYQAGMLDEPMVKVALLQELIDEHLRITDAKEAGYRVSPTELMKTITGIEVFHGENGFDRDQYKQLLQRQGLSIARFEADLAESLITDQVRLGLSSTAIVPATELDQLLQLQGQQRDIRFLLLARDAFAGSTIIKDDAIETFYNEHADRFQTPERVSIDYLELVLDNFAAKIEIDEQTLERLYAEQKNEFQVAEKRRASHLLVAVGEDADPGEERAALEKITNLKQQLDGGADFEALAISHSEDLGSARKGGDLGLFGRDIMDPQFEAAAFTLPLNKISNPVRSAFGYHLIKITEIQPAKLQPLAEVRDKISLRYRREQAEAAFFSATETLQDIAYEQPDSLQSAADALGLEIKRSDLFPRFGGEGITGISEIIEQAFSDEVLQSGQNSTVVNIENSRSVVLRVADHELPATRPLAEVADSIREILSEQATSDAVNSHGKNLIEKLQRGEDIQTDLEEMSVNWEERLAVTRRQPGLPPQMLTELFRMSVTQATANFKGLSLDNGDYVVFTVTKLHADPLPPTDEQRQQLGRDMERLRGDIAFIGYLKSLRESAEIKIFPENL